MELYRFIDFVNTIILCSILVNKRLEGASKWPALLRYGWRISMILAIIIANNNICDKNERV